MFRHALIATTLLAAALGVGAPLALAQQVGTTAAVNPAATGAAPGSKARTLKIGSDVVYEERIQTTGSGALQVLFVDRTSLSIGPNSDITIDEFVFNPNQGTGSFVATLTKGSLRFVGGKISRNSGATIRTQTATIGIRGSVVGVENNIDFGGGFKVANYQGNVRVDLPGGQQYTLSQGTQLVVVEDSGGQQTQTVTTVDEGTAGADTQTETASNGEGGEEGGGAEEPGGEDPGAGGGAPEEPPVYVPPEMEEAYRQDPPPPSPPEPDPDPLPDP